MKIHPIPRPLPNGGSGISHDNGNAGACLNVGEAFGKAMAGILQSHK